MEENLVELDVVHKEHDYKIIVDINNANIILNDPVKGYEIVETFLKTQGYAQQNPSLTCTSGTEIIWAKRRPDDIDTKATEEFLQLRIKYDPLFVNKKQSHSVIFNKIASELTLKGYNLGSDPGKKCVHKFNNLQKTYIAYRNHVNTTGVEYKEPPPFYELLHSLLGSKDKCIPRNILDSENPQKDEENSQNCFQEQKENSMVVPSTEQEINEKSENSQHSRKMIKERFKKRTGIKPSSKTSFIITNLRHEIQTSRTQMNDHMKKLYDLNREQFEQTHSQRERFISVMEKLAKRGRKRRHLPSDSSDISD